MTNCCWDEDGNYDFDAHFHAIEREAATKTAEWIGYPGMIDAIHHFGLYGTNVSGEVFTAELLTAMDTWQVLLEKIELTEDELDRRTLQANYDTLDRTIHRMVDPRKWQVVSSP